MNRVGLTRNKALLIGVLASVLTVVLLQPPADPEASQNEPGAAVSQEAVPTASGKQLSPVRPNSRTASWPDVSIDEALSHNPFASLVLAEAGTPVDRPPVAVVAPSSPAAPPTGAEPHQDAEAEKQAALEDFRRLGVTLILKNKSKTCAVVGGQLVHEGDILHGVRIVAITSREVIVEPVSED